jgi:nicotinamidase-related amidase
MAVTLEELIEPTTTALLAMEVKRGSMGDLAVDYPLADAAREMGLLENLARLFATGRAVGATVVHCTSAFRPDGVGTARNAPVLAWGTRRNSDLLIGSENAQPALELGQVDSDIESLRTHGVSPFSGTELDAVLRSERIENLIVCGGSVNVGVLGTCIEAVNLGYRVVVPRNGVVGVPTHYVDDVLLHTIRLLAMVTTVDEIIDVWARRG